MRGQKALESSREKWAGKSTDDQWQLCCVCVCLFVCLSAFVFISVCLFVCVCVYLCVCVLFLQSVRYSPVLKESKGEQEG